MISKKLFCRFWIASGSFLIFTNACQLNSGTESKTLQSLDANRITVIEAINVIDGTGRQPFLADVVVKDKRIYKISESRLKYDDADVKTIDGRGKYLLPGFVDLLTHISFRSNLNASDPYELTPLFSDIHLPDHERLPIHKALLKSALKGGVTTFVDSISAISDIKRLRQNINDSEYPNFYSLGPIIGPPDGHPYPVHNSPWHYAVDSMQPIEQIRAKVIADFDTWFVEDGLLGIKVSIDSPPEGGHPASAPLSDEIVKVIFDAAKSKGKPIFFIAFTEDGIAKGARNGGNIKLGPPVVLSNQGLEIASDATFALLKESNVGVISLLSNWGGGMQAYLSDFEPQYPNSNALVYDTYFRDTNEATKNSYETLFDKFFRKDSLFIDAVYKSGRKLFTVAKRAIEKVHEFNIPIFASGDTGSFWVFHGHYYLELQHLSGTLTPMELIKAATLEPARAIGISDQVGSIEEGKLADMLIVTKSPLEDIVNLRRIESVIKSGVLLEP